MHILLGSLHSTGVMVLFLCMCVACANIFNVVLMRNNELKEGIEVFDKSGNVLGTSKVAAKKVCRCVCTDVHICVSQCV